MVGIHKLNLFGQTEKALFLERTNRFTLICELKGQTVQAFLPNSGRLWELLLPGAIVYLERSFKTTNKLPYTAVAVQKKDRPVMIHTHRTNDLAEYLIENDLIPGLAGAEIIKREIVAGRSRFDFLLCRDKKKILLEVKTCTLFGKQVAMFPDAVTSRGKRHVEELAALAGGNTLGVLLFLIFWPEARFFIPEYHTDLEFTRALLAAKDKAYIIPLAVELDEDLTLGSKVSVLEIPWKLIEKEAEDRGSYIVVLKLPQKSILTIGRLGEVAFNKGYYLYIGSARKNLTKRIQRHRSLRKRLFWHIDWLRAVAEFQFALPIRASDHLECNIAQMVKGIADWDTPGFGSSDCSCHSHLFGMLQDPRRSPAFMALLQHYRMDRLFSE